MGRKIQAAIALSLLLGVGALRPDLAAASTGIYTFPFFDTAVGVSQPYGCTSSSLELLWSGINADGTTYNCTGATPRFHKGIDYAHGSFDVVSSSAGVVADTWTSTKTSSCGGTPTNGDYVIIKVDALHYTLYYHLAYGSITVKNGQVVSAGQKIGVAGDTGPACGIHLHYELMDCVCNNSVPEDTYQPSGKWTTSPGLVPWLAHYYTESTTGTQDICYGDTVTHWVRFTNTGGLTWKTVNDSNGKGRIYFASTNSSGTASAASQFQAPDWESSSITGGADQSSVGPGGLGTFTFGLTGNGVVGDTYTVHFNLAASSLHWFDYVTEGQYFLNIYILPHQACP